MTIQRLYSYTNSFFMWILMSFLQNCYKIKKNWNIECSLQSNVATVNSVLHATSAWNLPCICFLFLFFVLVSLKEIAFSASDSYDKNFESKQHRCHCSFKLINFFFFCLWSFLCRKLHSVHAVLTLNYFVSEQCKNLSHTGRKCGFGLDPFCTFIPLAQLTGFLRSKTPHDNFYRTSYPSSPLFSFICSYHIVTITTVLFLAFKLLI